MRGKEDKECVQGLWGAFYRIEWGSNNPVVSARFTDEKTEAQTAVVHGEGLNELCLLLLSGRGRLVKM